MSQNITYKAGSNIFSDDFDIFIILFMWLGKIWLDMYHL